MSEEHKEQLSRIMMMIFGWIEAPLTDKQFLAEWRDGWLQSAEVQSRINGAGNLLRNGDCDSFFSLAQKLWNECIAIVEKHGGRTAIG